MLTELELKREFHEWSMRRKIRGCRPFGTVNSVYPIRLALSLRGTLAERRPASVIPRGAKRSRGISSLCDRLCDVEWVRGRKRLFAKSRFDIHVEAGIESALLYTSLYRAASTTRKGASAHGPLQCAETIDLGFEAKPEKDIDRSMAQQRR